MLIELALALALQTRTLCAADAGARPSFLQAVAELKASRFDAALRGFESVLKREPQQLEAAFYRGQCLYHLGRLDEAKAALTALSARAPEMPVTHYYLGRIAYDQSDLGEAFKQLQSAAALDPDLAMVRYYLGLVYFQHSQPNEAVLELKRCLELDPTLDRAAYALAFVSWNGLKQKAAAKSALQRLKGAKLDEALRKKVAALKKELAA